MRCNLWVVSSRGLFVTNITWTWCSQSMGSSIKASGGQIAIQFSITLSSSCTACSPDSLRWAACLRDIAFSAGKSMRSDCPSGQLSFMDDHALNLLNTSRSWSLHITREELHIHVQDSVYICHCSKPHCREMTCLVAFVHPSVYIVSSHIL